jgi:hypothetical protein
MKTLRQQIEEEANKKLAKVDALEKLQTQIAPLAAALSQRIDMRQVLRPDQYALLRHYAYPNFPEIMRIVMSKDTREEAITTLSAFAFSFDPKGPPIDDTMRDGDGRVVFDSDILNEIFATDLNCLVGVAKKHNSEKGVPEVPVQPAAPSATDVRAEILEGLEYEHQFIQSLGAAEPPAVPAVVAPPVPTPVARAKSVNRITICKIVSNHTFKQKVENAVHISLGCVFVKKEHPPAFNPTGKKPRPDDAKRERGDEGTLFLKGVSAQLHLAGSWPIFFMTLFARLPADIAIVRRAAPDNKCWAWELTDLGLTAMKKRDITHIQMFAGGYAAIFHSDMDIAPHENDKEAIAAANSFILNEDAIIKLRANLTPPPRPSSTSKIAASIKNAFATANAKTSPLPKGLEPTEENPAINLQNPHGLQGQRIDRRAI